MHEKVVVIPGLDGKILRGDALRIDRGDRVLDLIERRFSEVQNGSLPLRVCGATIGQDLMAL
jgi:hypothetical protein